MRTGTFHWGHGIALVYAAFAIGIVTMVIVASRNHNPGLVQKNYYDLDLNYQQRMDQKHNTAALTTLPTVRFDAQNATIDVQLPEGMVADKGKIKAFKPSMAVGELTQDFGQTNLIRLPLKTANGGYYRVELDWQAGGKAYYYETVITI